MIWNANQLKSGFLICWNCTFHDYTILANQWFNHWTLSFGCWINSNLMVWIANHAIYTAMLGNWLMSTSMAKMVQYPYRVCSEYWYFLGNVCEICIRYVYFAKYAFIFIKLFCSMSLFLLHWQTTGSLGLIYWKGRLDEYLFHCLIFYYFSFLKRYTIFWFK